jgi:hypothetical protein
MTNHLPSSTYIYREENLNEIQEKHFEEAWEVSDLNANFYLNFILI